ncbi:MAG: response regulator [Planctomycetes bacterium]|nr:response regulator [Planctomycetota bacterium]
MDKTPVLIIDDEKNIRLTMSHTLEDLELEIDTAVNGEEAIEKMDKRDFSLVFLDLRMPGMDGMDVLREIRKHHSKTPVVIITAHGTVDNAVEAMKLGVADFIQKPFSPREIRDLAMSVLRRGDVDEQNAISYESLIELAARRIADREFHLAMEAVKRAIAMEPSQPEAYNLLGALHEVTEDELEAQRFYRAALDIDPTFRPAQSNLERVTSFFRNGGIKLVADGDETGEKP